MGIRHIRCPGGRPVGCSQADGDVEGACYPFFFFLMTAAGLGWGGQNNLDLNLKGFGLLKEKK